MALKRTIVPFYGQATSEYVRAGTAAMQRGDRENASVFFERAELTVRKSYAAHIANNRRKRCNPGKTGRRTSRGY